jgi:ComF family protein
VAYGLYQGRMKEAIHALKYDRIHPAGRMLGQMLAQAIAQLASEAPAEMLVVPVPLHRSKQAERGFNQARTLAVHALEFLRKTHPQWRLTLAPGTLMRLRETESQAGLTSRQRRLNVRGAFSVANPATVDGKHILVIDDIFTTGATARAVAQALVNAGAASVWVATLARARRVSDHGYQNVGYAIADTIENKSGLSGYAGTAELEQKVKYSSQDQPSF